jgi:ATP-dependent Lhr-like helicase
MSYDLLAQPIRKYIRDKRWESLRPIQAAAISRILTTDLNYILASRTASGKTEAAFLPILSRVDFNEPGVQVLYISPLIALINDQFIRVEELCAYLDVTVTRWHGEASRSLKNKIINNPTGIVLITPESIEAMFVNAPYQVKTLFSNLKYIVIDEIHSFIGTERGVQLQSLLARLQEINTGKFIVVGLSATIGDYEEAKKMTGRPEETKVLLDRTAKEMDTAFRYFESGPKELSQDMIDDLYQKTKENKVLIFPNSRGRAEEIAVKLKKSADRNKGHAHYFSHHSSVDKELREYVEQFAKNNQHQNFCISCTSTLELGIDIGSVDQVVQVDATHSIASLIQRVGRSGRKEGARSSLLLYATDPWNLLQSLACYSLYKEGFIEPIKTSEQPFDILLHQMLSMVKGTSGMKKDELIKRIAANYAFKNIPADQVDQIIKHLVEMDFFESIGGELIIGVEGEKIVNSRDFYTVFSSDPNFKVIHAGKGIGEIPFSIQVRVDENILLAARIWKIVDVEERSSKIEVIPAKDGKKPLFFGSGGAIHHAIRQRMLELVCQKTPDISLEDETCQEIIRQLQKEFDPIPIKDPVLQRPVFITEKNAILYSFAGTHINRSLAFLLKQSGIDYTFDDKSSCFEIQHDGKTIHQLLDQVKTLIPQVDTLLATALAQGTLATAISKWGQYLPPSFQIQLMKERHYNFPALSTFLKTTQFITPIDTP